MLNQTFNVNVFKFYYLTQGSEADILKGKRKYKGKRKPL